MTDLSRQPVIVGAARTPIGRYLRGLASLSAPDLGAIAIKAALQRSGVNANDVQEVIMGHVLQGGTGQAPGRQAMLKAGVPATASALTVNKVCGSGLKAVMLAAQSIKAGDAQVVIAGGQESMSNAPHYVYGMRGGVKIGDQSMVDGMIKDGLWCGTYQVHMGSHAEYTATKGRSRAKSRTRLRPIRTPRPLRPRRRASSRWKSCRWRFPARRDRPSSIPMKVRAPTPRPIRSPLRPAFPNKGGDNSTLSVTAGNASSLNDGAAAVVVTSEAYAREHNLTILARITGYATGAGDPRDLFSHPSRR